MRRVNSTLPILLLVLIGVLFAGVACKKASEPAPLAPVAVVPKKAATEEPAQTETEEQVEKFSYKVTERNPFASLLVVDKLSEDEIPEEELTPLQRIPVGDLRVESIIVSRRRSVAHLIAPDGKAHIVSVGTLIGRHKGKVVRIKSDEVIVEEEYKDYLGKLVKQESTLRLRLKEGENL